MSSATEIENAEIKQEPIFSDFRENMCENDALNTISESLICNVKKEPEEPNEDITVEHFVVPVNIKVNSHNVLRNNEDAVTREESCIKKHTKKTKGSKDHNRESAGKRKKQIENVPDTCIKDYSVASPSKSIKKHTKRTKGSKNHNRESAGKCKKQIENVPDTCMKDYSVASPSKRIMSKEEPTSPTAGPSYPCVVTPDGTVRVQDATLYEVTSSGRTRPRKPPTTPIIASPVGSPQMGASIETGAHRRKRIRRSLKLEADISAILQDSGSDCDGDDYFSRVPGPSGSGPGTGGILSLETDDEAGSDDGKDGKEDYEDFCLLRQAARQMREEIVNEESMEKDECEGIISSVSENLNEQVEDMSVKEIVNERVININEECELIDDDVVEDVVRDLVDERESVTHDRGEMQARDFVWSDDFQTFTGQKETYLRDPGPTFYSQDPQEIFSQIWDDEFMATLAKETNKYVEDFIFLLSDPDLGRNIPKYLSTWTEVTVAELRRYFAVLILLSFCQRTKINYYWDTGIMGMPAFRKIMPRARFLLLSRFLHFVSNDSLNSRGNDRKIEKVKPIVDHCNKKFADLYTPAQHISLDESLLLWKGRLSWKQCIRTKAARFGIKSFELCEAETGYLLQYRLYTGKDTVLHSEPSHGFKDHTARVVLDLMERFLNVGHVLVMDNWYNQLPLTRYLKSQRTDVLGTVNRRRQLVPDAIKSLDPSRVERGATVGRHSGDIALVAWKDVKLVTVLSTYHNHRMVRARRVGKVVQKPVAVQEYNRYMGGVDLKDQKLSMFLMERKRSQKWYMKVFRRLLNTSLLNAFIIYTRNPMYKVYSHRQFRMKVAQGLLKRTAPDIVVPSRGVSNTTQELVLRLQQGKHFPVPTEVSTTGKAKHKQLRCVRCTALKKRVAVTIMCSLCKVPLCIGQCWADYHTLENLT